MTPRDTSSTSLDAASSTASLLMESLPETARSSNGSSTTPTQFNSSSMVGDSPETPSQLSPNNRPWVIAASIAVYWSFVSLIPIYNKFFFHKNLYPYPVASAGIQLGVVCLLLAVHSLVRHWVGRSTVTSWLFGPGTWYKIAWTAPIGILFGLKYGVTNLGLALVPAPTHLLLQATDLVWTCIAAWFIKDERLNWVGYLCVLGCIVGSAITSVTSILNLGDKDGSASGHPNGLSLELFGLRGSVTSYQWWALGVNLLSPILLGLCITTLRVACKKLLVPCNPRLGGTTMDSFELTCWKLGMSSTVAILMACWMEGPKTGTVFPEGSEVAVVTTIKQGWFSAFVSLNSFTQWGVIVGSVLILVFQVNCTYLTHLTSAYAVGLVGQLKIIPQWVTAALIAPEQSFHLHKGNVLGALITMVAATIFAFHNYFTTKNAFGEEDSSLHHGAVNETSRLLGSSKECYDPESHSNLNGEDHSAGKDFGEDRPPRQHSYLFCNLW
eukprot:Nitzschia sp. Nitz4//scaffold217_size45653//40092//41834//NITZ4_007230-RA/size45653-processed-gene-0.22-mRNA-1//1//CDS//3329542255//8578//frame0